MANFQKVVRECELQIQSNAENMRRMQDTYDTAIAQSKNFLRLKEAEIEALHEKLATRSVPPHADSPVPEVQTCPPSTYVVV